MNSFARYLLAISLLISAATISWAGWPDDSQLAKVPASANAILAIDVKGAFASPLGQAQGWSKRYSETNHASLGSLPPSVETLTIAAQFDYATMNSIWQVGLVNSQITLDDVAKAEGGVVNKFGNQNAVASPRGAYFANVGNYQMAVYAPADRQAFARWLRAQDSGKEGAGPYLRKALASRGNAQLVVAANLSDMVDPVASRLYLGHLPTAVKWNMDPTAISMLFAGIKGATLRVTVTDKMTGQLQIDFGDDIGILAQQLPDLILDMMADAGAVLSDLKSWTPKVAGGTLTMEGELSPSSLRKIISLFELPTGPDREAMSPGVESNKASVNATLRYYKSVNDILGELRQIKSKLDTDKSYEKYALWYDTYAKKIDYLPVLGVDADLVDFGTKTAGVLRAIAGSLRGVPLKTNEAGAGAYFYYSAFGSSSRRYGGWGSVNVDTNVDQVRQQQQKIISDDSAHRNDAWKEIDDQLGMIRAKLSERYKLSLQ